MQKQHDTLYILNRFIHSFTHYIPLFLLLSLLQTSPSSSNLPKLLLLPPRLLCLGFQLSLSLLLLPGGPPELFKAVAGGAHGGGRRRLGLLSEAGPRTHVL